MFLKRLELHGFKSFAHRTTIDFLEGVTIVVGPNGCGKSNVLDAIRWVLGATSAKSLRGSKMGDVVFRGSASLKPAHFAQVNLIVDNEASHLKLDQSEVMVTRRLFSNGDSGYQINKQKARMRDIHEMFMDTGLGAENYAIIEQGQISNMVQAKPHQRREIFEEAAGISRYKARREETMRKLVRTEEDLIRLFDIVSEVQRACNSLYRQARKAIRYRKSKRRLVRMQKRLLVLRRERLDEKLGKIEVNLTTSRDQFEQANAALAQAEAKRAEATRLMEDYQHKSQDLQQQRFDLQQAINREQRRIESAKQNMQAITDRSVLLQREVNSSSSRVQILANTIQVLDMDLERERTELSEYTGGADNKNRELDDLRRQMNDANTEMSRLRQQLNTERQKENKLQQDKRLSESLVERLQSEMSNHGTQMEFIRKEAEEAQLDAEIAKEDLEKRSAKLKEIIETQQTFQNNINRQSQAKGQLASMLDELTRQYNKASSRLNALQELEDSYEGFFRGVQVVMRAAQHDHLSGIIGVLSTLITVPNEYEKALEVALGGSVQDIVAATERDAQAAIRYLKEKKAGRATFLPLDLLRTNVQYDHLRPILGRNGVLGLAKNLIKFDGQISRAIERRLGNTIIVEDLPIAIQLQREGIRNRYVSLDGELADPSGVLTGGSHQSRGLLSRSREIRQLREEVEKLDIQRKELTDKLKETQDQLSQYHARAAELQAEKHAEQMSEARAEKDLQNAEKAMKERRNALATSEARETQQRLDIGQHQERIVECDIALEAIQEIIREREYDLADIENNMEDRRGKLSSLGEEVSANRATMSGLRERVTSLDKRLREERDELRLAGSDKGTRVAEITKLADEKIEAEVEVEEGELLLVDLTKQYEILQASISQLDQENSSSLTEARTYAGQVQQLQRDRNIKENTFREVENECTNLKAQIELREEEAQEEFSVSIAELATQLEEDNNLENESLSSPDEGDDDDQEEQKKEEADDAKDFEEDDAITDPKDLSHRVSELRDKIGRMGNVNETAIDEFKEQKERLDFLTTQRDDLITAKDSLTETIQNLDETTSKLFDEAYTQIRQNFQEMFRRLFNGGKGDLIVVEDENSPEPGIDIYAQPPGKNIGGSIALMSGGEKAMTAIALMLSLFQYKPSPVCILDEIDAPLDDVNCARLCEALKDFAKGTQFLIITHNKITMGLADTVYGITMQEPGISKMVSVRFDSIEDSGLLEEKETNSAG